MLFNICTQLHDSEIRTSTHVNMFLIPESSVMCFPHRKSFDYHVRLYKLPGQRYIPSILPSNVPVHAFFRDLIVYAIGPFAIRRTLD